MSANRLLLSAIYWNLRTSPSYLDDLFILIVYLPHSEQSESNLKNFTWISHLKFEKINYVHN